MENLNKIFLNSIPFNHIVIDSFLPNKTAEILLDEIDKNSVWDIRNDRNTEVKWRSDWKKSSDVPTKTYSIIQYLNSGDFLSWLSLVTGINGLIPISIFQ